MLKFRRQIPFYISIIAIMVFIGIYFYIRKNNPDEASEIIVTILAIIAGVSFWLEYHHNGKVNEAQFVMELNNQFVTDDKMVTVEHRLEKYYYLVKNGYSQQSIEEERMRLERYFDIDNNERQDLVNYLVHLEGIAALVNSGVIKLSTINDLMAYRFFLAVKNPVVQELEIKPYHEYYKGIEILYGRWCKAVKEVPLKELDGIMTDGN